MSFHKLCNGYSGPEKESEEKRRILEETDYVDEEEDRTGVSLTALNVVNNLLGGGIIAFSFAFKETGFGTGLIVTILVGIISAYTLVILAEAGRLCNHRTYQKVGQTAFGRPCSVIIGILQFMTCITSLVSYNVYIADNLSKVLIRILKMDGIDSLQEHFWGSRPFLIAIPLIVITLPLSSQKHVGSLSKLGVCTVLCTVASLVFFWIKVFDYRMKSTKSAYTFVTKNFITGIAIISSGFMTHESTFVFYNSLYNPTKKRWLVVSTLGFVTSTVVMLLMGIVGYVTFEERVVGNLFENYCSDDDLINAARFVLVVTLFIAFPVGLYAGREVIEHSFFADFQTFKYTRHILIGILITALTFGLSLTTDCLGIVLEISGIFTAAPLAFIIPPILLIKLHDRPLWNKYNICPLLVAVFGVLVMVTGTINVIREIVQGTVTCLGGHQPSYCLGGNNSESTTSLYNMSYLNEHLFNVTSAFNTSGYHLANDSSLIKDFFDVL